MSLKDIQQQQQRPLHILITGSSQGIGLAAAQRLIQDGHTVYHACRTLERAEQAVKDSGGGVAMVCDLSDLRSVKTFAKQVHAQIPRLDVVCCNAGIAPSTQATVPPLTAQGYEACIGVNHLGHFLVAQLLYSKLAASNSKAIGGGRLVFTASSVHDPELKAGQSGGKTAGLGDLSGLGVNLLSSGNDLLHNTLPTMVDGSVEYSGAKVYKDSKLCNILTCRHGVEAFPDTITSVCFNPGFVPTTGLFSSLRNESWMKATALTLFASLMGVSVPVQVAGDRLAYMATAPNLKSGSYFCAPAKSLGTTPEDGFVETAVSKEASNNILAIKLWQKSLEIVHEWL